MVDVVIEDDPSRTLMDGTGIHIDREFEYISAVLNHALQFWPKTFGALFCLDVL